MIAAPKTRPPYLDVRDHIPHAKRKFEQFFDELKRVEGALSAGKRADIRLRIETALNLLERSGVQRFLRHASDVMDGCEKNWEREDSESAKKIAGICSAISHSCWLLLSHYDDNQELIDPMLPECRKRLEEMLAHFASLEIDEDDAAVTEAPKRRRIGSKGDREFSRHVLRARRGRRNSSVGR
ncbi:hypothetical protein COV82_06250 [Candidatus Peregrinibacteria bacterium CG11_big_fil_rev_8_21_14_0_20_46_8]|nr:MAG: hypothetical protein COV82_06250 [Candidatus Peregrinibacteria bacterium CG11_big_fil_rev_8_21_14_0_20_46_8]